MSVGITFGFPGFRFVGRKGNLRGRLILDRKGNRSVILLSDGRCLKIGKCLSVDGY